MWKFPALSHYMQDFRHFPFSLSFMQAIRTLPNIKTWRIMTRIIHIETQGDSSTTDRLTTDTTTYNHWLTTDYNIFLLELWSFAIFFCSFSHSLLSVLLSTKFLDMPLKNPWANPNPESCPFWQTKSVRPVLKSLASVSNNCFMMVANKDIFLVW